jgi:hypothetical protein
MPTWEETKRAGQTAFISQGESVQAAHESVDNFYRQILTRGYVSPSIEGGDMSHQIADQVYEPTREDWKDYERYLDEYQWPEQEPGMGMDER